MNKEKDFLFLSFYYSQDGYKLWLNIFMQKSVIQSNFETRDNNFLISNQFNNRFHTILTFKFEWLLRCLIISSPFSNLIFYKHNLWQKLQSMFMIEETDYMKYMTIILLYFSNKPTFVNDHFYDLFFTYFFACNCPKLLFSSVIDIMATSYKVDCAPVILHKLLLKISQQVAD